MSVNEQMVQDIVKEVVAKLQLHETSAQHGVFADMNEAIEAAKKAQKEVHKNGNGPERTNHLQHP